MSTSALRALHVPGTPLILPNVWDAASAKLVEQAGFPVVATGSAAVAESLGYPDHHGTPVETAFAAFARITRAVSVPVTIDVEGGYGLPEAVLGTRLSDIGAVGCNFEDTDFENGGLVEANKQADRIAALKGAFSELVVNARVDVFITAQDQKAVLDEGIERARAYLAAGADCVFPILIRDTEVLRTFTEAVAPAAVNTVYLPNGPDFAGLAQLGVARISLGPGLFHFVKTQLQEKLTQIAAGERPY
ncbi:isocitrate lyase/phosphoenolpyruvate mutase family protein [Kibdelosporangium philippinense]|uniref:Isocitrate lyase/phosphoenolpyruvate mutase family protein n=1 Tax=Kibdelosporangium philippinense TaxID=211113 RepID=A0ABS8ZX25_9PSEU|nr:isocitrate lyase/phosphoenolpyruvate mutase family protein [Kibdelosporangium philippinense]MCE7010437.1 isocitrate lyase/phosphoenolpyruvate mutase family protein [Kibdelosporangium philippinense]